MFIHCNIADGLITNGDLSSEKSTLDENDADVHDQLDDVMEVDDTQSSDSSSNDIDQSNESDDESDNENYNNMGHKISEPDDNEDVVHMIDNSDDEVSEIIDDNSVSSSRSEKEENQLQVNVSENNSDNEMILEDKSENGDNEQVVLNDSGDTDIELIENETLKENGNSHSPIALNETINLDDDEVITIDSPIKKAKKPVVEAPVRRSARNLNKPNRKSYKEEDEDEEVPVKNKETTELITKNVINSVNTVGLSNDKMNEMDEEESDIEEVLPEDPLAVGEPINHIDRPHRRKQTFPSMGGSTIVVKDTKRLVEIATKSSPSVPSGKKEPTLVIIDTNSILSGRGPIPVNHKSPGTHSYPVLPAALPAQGLYPPNMRATITPIPMNSSTTPSAVPSAISPPTSIPIIMSTLSKPISASTIMPQIPGVVPVPMQHVSAPAPILPSLTDDMFVVEAPSFIVPYVYEKPPVQDLKEFVDDYGKKLSEEKKIDADNKHGQHERKEGNSSEIEHKNVENEKIEHGEDNISESDNKINSIAKEEEKTEIDVEEELDKELDNRIKKGDKLDSVNKNDFKLDLSKSKLYGEFPKKSHTYFDSPIGKFLMDVGHDLVQEHVQTDLLRQQKRKREREAGKNPETNKTIQSLMKSLEFTKENNEPYRMPLKKCEFCSFKTESSLAMVFHLETPHMKNFVYRCNFCSFEVRSPHEILYHMETVHSVRGRLERAPAFHQCPNCSFEDNQKGKLSRHMVTCARKFRPERNLEPPIDWEPPAKIPRVPRIKQANITNTSAMYQAMTKNSQYPFMKMQNATSALNRGRGRPSLNNMKANSMMRTPMLYKQNMSGGSVLLPTNYQLSGSQLYQVIILLFNNANIIVK